MNCTIFADLLMFLFFRLHLICLFLHLVGLLQDRQLSKAREEIKATKGRSSRKYVVQQRNKAAVALNIENMERANVERGWFQSKLMSSHCLSILPKMFHLAFMISILPKIVHAAVFIIHLLKVLSRAKLFLFYTLFYAEILEPTK